MMFYSVYEKKPIEIPAGNIKIVKLANDRFQAQAKDSQGRTLYKFVKSK